MSIERKNGKSLLCLSHQATLFFQVLGNTHSPANLSRTLRCAKRSSTLVVYALCVSRSTSTLAFSLNREQSVKELLYNFSSVNNTVTVMHYFNNEEKKMKKPNLYGFCSYFLFSHFVYKGTYNLSGRSQISHTKSNPWKF